MTDITTATSEENSDKKSVKKSYFREVQAELKKISWTDKKELILSAKIVLISTFLFGIAIYATDMTCQTCISLIRNFAKMIIG
ncbi:MAG TPA: preprotein translocase subunit SecE [Chlamydiales bacterium]|nr:preprotein translocase subunit SecE [Chlamydiales bacterium]